MNLTQSFNTILRFGNQLRLIQNTQSTDDIDHSTQLQNQVIQQLIDLPPIMPFRSIVYITDDRIRVKLLVDLFTQTLIRLNITHSIVSYSKNTFLGCTIRLGVTNTIIQFRTIDFVNNLNYIGTTIDHAIFDCTPDFRLNNVSNYTTALHNIIQQMRRQ